MWSFEKAARLTRGLYEPVSQVDGKVSSNYRPFKF